MVKENRNDEHEPASPTLNPSPMFHAYLADYGRLRSKPSSLDTLVGTFPSKANEKLMSVDGFSSFWQARSQTNII